MQWMFWTSLIMKPMLQTASMELGTVMKYPTQLKAKKVLVATDTFLNFLNLIQMISDSLLLPPKTILLHQATKSMAFSPLVQMDVEQVHIGQLQTVPILPSMAHL